MQFQAKPFTQSHLDQARPGVSTKQQTEFRRAPPQPPQAAASTVSNSGAVPSLNRVKRRRGEHTEDVEVTTLESMPVYSDLDHDAVRATLELLPADRLWFTYASIQRSFGVSRATAARRMKEKMIPGIQFCGDRVAEEGAIRRFSRTQLYWLLLAVKTGRRGVPAPRR